MSSETFFLRCVVPSDLVRSIDEKVDGRMVRSRTAALVMVIEAGLKALAAPEKGRKT